MVDKYRYLLKNVGLMTISNFSSKILSFLLVPLYTNVLSPTEYGIYDFCVTTMFLVAPLLCANIAEAVVRFLLDKSKDPKLVFSIGLKIDLRACIVFAILVFLNAKFEIVKVFVSYSHLLIIYFALMLLSDLLIQLARGIEQMRECAIAGIISSAVMLIFNVLFLLVFSFGLEGYFIANILSLFVSIIYLATRIKVWNYIVVGMKTQELQKEMTVYSSPLIFNSIGSWINNVSDRYIVTLICGVSANGIYSVAYKVPAVLNVFQTIFSQVWTVSVVKAYDEKDSKFYSEIYKIFNLMIVILCSLLLVLNKMVAKVLFAKEFYIAWKCAPFLLISVVFSSLAELVGGVFIAAKKTEVIARTTLMGSIINTILNIVLVYCLGPIGAAIATVISFILIWIARITCVQKIVDLEINICQNAVSYLILLVQAFLLLFIENTVLLYSVELLCFLLVCCLYLKTLLKYKYKILSCFSRRNKND